MIKKNYYFYPTFSEKLGPETLTSQFRREVKTKFGGH